MNAILFASSGAFAPMRALLRRFSIGQPSAVRPATAARSKTWRVDRQVLAPLASTPIPRPRQGPVGLARIRSSLPLRVIRVLDGDRPTQYGGRMRISGRMADVCAELDRMAAREDQALAPAR